MTERAWHHSRKGKIVGVEIGGDDTWMHVRLTQDAWVDVRRRHRDEAGSVQTYRRNLMTPTVRINLAEQGRQRASEREELIAAGANPAELTIPLHPDQQATP